jgi:ribonuclease HI
MTVPVRRAAQAGAGLPLSPARGRGVRGEGENPSAWIDGGARGNPGEAGFGVVFEIPGPGGVSETVEICGYLGRATNNIAEYAALLAALAFAARRGFEGLTLHSDSELLVRQLAGSYKVKAPHLRRLHQRALRLRGAIPRLVVRHVRREENHHADRLANRAMDERLPPPPWLASELDDARLG